MDHNPVPPAATTGLSPRRQQLLADIQINPAETRPLGGLNPYSPPFDTIGQQFAKLLADHAGLTPSTKLLDLGCGTGRLTKPLQGTLTEGSYHGLDVHPRFLDFCRQTYTAPNFQFDHLDIRHDEYNPEGKIETTNARLPYATNSFDLVAAVAVFNHFHTSWVFQYVREMGRVLKPRGVLFATILLLNKQSMEFINTRKEPPYSFQHRTPESWHDFRDRPLFNVAHPEEAIRRVFIKSNLMIREPISYGQWCRTQAGLTGPDVIFASKGGWR